MRSFEASWPTFARVFQVLLGVGRQGLEERALAAKARSQSAGVILKLTLVLCSVQELRAYALPLPHLSHITPTPVFMAVNTRDTNTPPDLSMSYYSKTNEPKELYLIEGNHYEVLGKNIDFLLTKQIAFLKRTLCRS